MRGVAPLRRTDPQRLGDFRLTGRLGEGGQGVVYRGESRLGEVVAVKLLHARLGDDATTRSNLAKALAAAQQVDPFCTARILAADVDGEAPYIVSEYIQGPSLQGAVDSHGPPAGDVLNRLAITTATAVTAIHQAGVVHRDLKPSNVLLGSDGARIIDFGIARALDANTSASSGVIGTPAYLAPEQLSGHDLTAAVDVWAWAATMVYASCARPPFGQDSIPVVITRILNKPPDLGTLQGRLGQLVRECLAKDPRERPSSQYVLMRLLDTEDSARPARRTPAMTPRPAVPAVAATASPAATAVTRAGPGAGVAGTGTHRLMAGTRHESAVVADPGDTGINVRIASVARGAMDGPPVREARQADRRTTMRNVAVAVAAAIVVGVAAAVFFWPDSGGSQPGRGQQSTSVSPMPKE